MNRPLVERGTRERKKWKGLWTDLWGRRSTAPAVHQILMQAPIGENTDCWQVWLTSAFRSARNTRLEITKLSKDCLVCYTAVFSVVTQRSSPLWGGALRDDTKNCCVADLRLLSLFKSYYQRRNYALQSKDSHYLLDRKTLGWSLPSQNAILHSWCSFGLSCTWIL